MPLLVPGARLDSTLPARRARSALPPVAALAAALAALRLRLQPLWDLAELAARRADELNEE